MTPVASELHRILEDRNWSQSRLARRLGVDYADVSRWVNGVRPLRLAMFARIAVALDLTEAEIGRVVLAAHPSTQGCARVVKAAQGTQEGS